MKITHEINPALVDDPLIRRFWEVVKNNFLEMDRGLAFVVAQENSPQIAPPSLVDYFYLPGRDGGQIGIGGRNPTDTLELRGNITTTPGQIVFRTRNDYSAAIPSLSLVTLDGNFTPWEVDTNGVMRIRDNTLYSTNPTMIAVAARGTTAGPAISIGRYSSGTSFSPTLHLLLTGQIVSFSNTESLTAAPAGSGLSFGQYFSGSTRGVFFSISGRTWQIDLTSTGNPATWVIPTNSAGYLLNNGSGTLSWAASAAPSAHALLDSGVHSDTVTQGPTAGSMIYANSSGPSKWDELIIGSTHRQVLHRSSAGLPAWTAPLYPEFAFLGNVIYAQADNDLAALGNVVVGNALISGGITSIPSWGKIGLTTHVSGVLPLANGGTNINAASATDLFNQLDPLTTKGDLLVRNTTDSIRLAVGTDTHVLTADSAQASGVKWAAASGGAAVADNTGTIGEVRVQGVAATAMRSDAAPPIDLAMTPLWTGDHTFGSGVMLDTSGEGSPSYPLTLRTDTGSGFDDVWAMKITDDSTGFITRVRANPSLPSDVDVSFPQAGGTLVTGTGLTSGRVALVSAGGVITSDADMTFGTDTLTVTKLVVGAGATIAKLDAGVYTPTLTGVANVAASTAYQCQYLRVGTVVTVSGKVDIDVTAAAATQVGISLPIASNIGANEDLGGTAASAATLTEAAAILGDAANNRAEMNYVAINITNRSWYFTFTYRII